MNFYNGFIVIKVCIGLFCIVLMKKVVLIKVTMDFTAIEIKPAKIALMGHNGVGHAVSHSGFRQDDSYGFAMLVNMLSLCVPLDLTIKKYLDGYLWY